MRIGIDLGTTNSLGVLFREGHAELIPNIYGSYLTPSVVGIDDDGKIIVGQVAKERIVSHPALSASSFKRYMGTDHKFILGRQSFTAAELSGLVIASIIEDAARFTGETPEEIIVSVPAYFHDRQRQDTKKAGALAGVHVRRLINEPSAAAIGSYMADKRPSTYLVFDFGGGTLDVSVVDCFDEMVQIIAVAGDNLLGGDDFNRCIADSALKEHGIRPEALTASEYAVLLRLAEAAKAELTGKEEAILSFHLRNQTYTSRFDTNRIAADGAALFARIRKVLEEALKGASMSFHDIDAIILAGGSSIMPSVRLYLSLLFPQTRLIDGNGQTMIAMGLGHVLGIMDRDAAIRDYILTDICPFTLGISIHNPSQPDRPYMSPIIPRNTPLPTSRENMYVTVSDAQTQIRIDVLQGESMFADENTQLGKLDLAVPPAPAGQQSVAVRFSYDIDGLLEIDTLVPSTRERIAAAYGASLDKKDMEAAKKRLAALKFDPKDRSENRLLVAQLQAAYSMAPPDARDVLLRMYDQYIRALQAQNEKQIRHMRRLVIAELRAIDQIDPFFRWEEEKEETDKDDNRNEP